MTQVQRIFGLACVLALGFVLIALAGALHENWLPLWIIAMFLIAPVPNALFGNSQSDDLMSETPDLLVDFGRFCTGAFLVSGIALPVVFAHCQLITHTAAAMSLIGGLIIYGSIITFGTFFYESDEI